MYRDKDYFVLYAEEGVDVHREFHDACCRTIYGRMDQRGVEVVSCLLTNLNLRAERR
jgi:hypothetical protein